MQLPRQEISIIGILLVLLGLLLNPFHLWMPGMMEMVIVAALVAAFALFAVLVWRERPRDEREGVHQLRAGRLGFLAGAAMLTAGIVLQVFEHALDPWLPLTLGAMVVAKALSFIYSRMRN